MTSNLAKVGVGFCLVVLTITGCATDSVPPAPYDPYVPTELTGASSEQLRADLGTFLTQAERFFRRKPIMIQHDRADMEGLEVGEDYVSIRFTRAWIAENEPRRDEYYRYGFLFEKLPELTFNGDTCWTRGAPLPDAAVRFSAPPGRQLCDTLYTLGLRAQKQRDVDEARFVQLAPQARGRIAATIPESLRRLIVEAEALRQEKNYAAGTFRKVIRQEPVAYPAAHFNLALLYEIQGDYPAAIQSMRKYLMLQPPAADARAAQDKIYEWEMKAARR